LNGVEQKEAKGTKEETKAKVRQNRVEEIVLVTDDFARTLEVQTQRTEGAGPIRDCAMSAATRIVNSLRKRLTLLDCLVLVAIAGVLTALLVPDAQWVSDGDIDIPVRVLVFDAKRAVPIPNARVVVARATSWTDDGFLKDFRERFPDIELLDRDLNDGLKGLGQGQTSEDGTVTIPFRFRTNASNESPVTRAHVGWAWIAVQAEGYAGVVIPVGNESVPTKKLREQKELRVPIGLMPIRN
jgi:hypothetical protein